MLTFQLLSKSHVFHDNLVVANQRIAEGFSLALTNIVHANTNTAHTARISVFFHGDIISNLKFHTACIYIYFKMSIQFLRLFVSLLYRILHFLIEFFNSVYILSII